MFASAARTPIPIEGRAPKPAPVLPTPVGARWGARVSRRRGASNRRLDELVGLELSGLVAQAPRGLLAVGALRTLRNATRRKRCIATSIKGSATI